MTGEIFVKWTVRPASPPRPLRHCSGCGATRTFYSSGRVRLNANSRRLDAWLIYKCSVCDRTWNRPLLDRAPLGTIAPADLTAMEQSDTRWVAAHEFDLTGLKKLCTAVEMSEDVVIGRPRRPEGLMVSAVDLALVCDVKVSLRLDRFLAQAFSLSRSKIQALWRHSAISTAQPAKNALSKPVSSVGAVRLDLACMSESDQRAIISALFE